MTSMCENPIPTGALVTALALLLACGGDGNAVDAREIDAPPPVGTWSLTWSVENAGVALPCERVLGVTVTVTAVPVEGGTGYPNAFACNAGSATGAAIPANVYNVQVSLTTSDSRVLAPPVGLGTVEITEGGNTPLGDVVFQVVPAGNVEFTIDAGEPGGNCEAEENGGAGLSELRIDYMGPDGQCVPATFTIADGANRPGGTYVSDCGITRSPCIDADQVVRGEGVPSGTVSMNIVGYRGVDECFTRMPLFSVPGNDLVTVLQPQTLMPVGACAAP